MRGEISMSENFQFSKVELEDYEKKIMALGGVESLPDPAKPDLLEDMEPEENLEKILRFEKEMWGIDWRAFYANDPGEVPKVESYLKQLGALFTASDLLSGDKVDPVPNISVSNSMEDGHPRYFINDMIAARGEKLEKLITEQLDHLQAAQNQFNKGDVVGGSDKMFFAGMVGVGLWWAKDFCKGVFIGWGARRAAVAAAKGLGSKFCFNMVGYVVTLGLKRLLDHKEQIIVLVVNRTGNGMNFANYYEQNGKVISFPEVSAGDDRVHDDQAVARAARYPDPDGIEIAQAGWIFASKRDRAMKGVKAAFKITFTGDNENFFTNGAYLGFSVPYSGSNKCGCSLEPFASAEEYLTKESDTFSIGQEKGRAGGAQIQSYLNSKSGGEVSMIVVCQAPYPESK
jgi:hypothetical protein